MISSPRRREDYGHGVVELDADFVTEQDVLARLKAAFAAPDYEPPLLPTAALTLLELVRNPNTSSRDVLTVLEHDPFIAGRILRAAQSPVYGALTPVRSLEQGISRLGMATMSEIFFHVSVSSRVFRAKGYERPMDALRNHSVAVAHVSRLVCRATALPDEYAFLCGLLHDIGVAAAFIVLADVRPPKQPLPLADVQKPVFDVHTDASAIVCSTWKLPPDVCLVVAHHHHPRIDGRVHPMAAAIGLAEQLCQAKGFGIGGEELVPFDYEQALGLSKVTRRRLEADAAELLSKLA